MTQWDLTNETRFSKQLSIGNTQKSGT